MSDDAPVDLSALDPGRDGRRWEEMVRRTVAHATATPEPWWAQLAQVRLGVLALAAVAVLAWLPVLLGGTATSASKAEDPALALVQYSHGGDLTALLESTDGY